MITVTVILGEDAVKKYNNTGEVPSEEWLMNNGGVVDVKTFKTQAEYAAYVLALNDAEGWHDHAILEPEISEDPDCPYCDGWRKKFADNIHPVYCAACGKKLREGIQPSPEEPCQTGGIESALRRLLDVAMLEIPCFEQSETFEICAKALGITDLSKFNRYEPNKGKVICTVCGGTNVVCGGSINPNTNLDTKK